MSSEESKPTPEEWVVAIATYRESHRKLIALGAHLIETGQDLTPLKEIVDGLTETQAKEMLTVALAGDASDYNDQRRRSSLN
jgi:hypothetical protein